jgi:hypothetical protein
LIFKKSLYAKNQKRRIPCNLMLKFLSTKKFGICRIPRLGTGRLKNDIGHVTHQSIIICIKMKKICTFRGRKAKISLQSPKSEFGVHRPEILYGARKTILLEAKKAKIGSMKLGSKIRLVVWYIHRSEILYGARKTILLEVKRRK